MKEKEYFLDTYWMPQVPRGVELRVVNNSGFYLGLRYQEITLERNLGHVDSSKLGHDHKLLGWSMSWILPALVAYSEGLDFVYKEQDCLAFGDWLQAIMRGDAAFGKNSGMPCEQSLFFIRHSFILDFVTAYMAMPKPDIIDVPESKFARLMNEFPDRITFHDLPCGRNRPMPLVKDRPWYVQRIEPNELQQLKSWGFI